METIIQSQNDTRNYRGIELENGLRALLIADLKSLDEDCQDGEDTDAESLASDTDPEEGDEMEQSGDDEADSDDEDHKEDKKKPQGEKLSAAALCIEVGSFSDPAELPGLAHFLEHMVFMGSEKYPDENHFDSFLKDHGGSSNAYTDCERTVFYFDVRKKHFREALDIFAQFFIRPLMKKDSADREIKAVDSEFDMAKTSDKNRKEQLLSSFAKENHPMGKFMWGNIDTLKTTPGSQGLDIYSYLQTFHKASYSSHYMTLAVQSRDELDTQEDWVREVFSEVPNNGQAGPEFTGLKEPFETEKFLKLYKVVPVQNLNVIELTWSLPCLLQHYKVKPLHYLGWLIGHEGKGSILSYLKKKYWATRIDCGNSESGFEHNSTYAVFSISVSLTETGMDHIQEVLAAIFEYLAMLRKAGAQRQIFDEIQQIENNDFRWVEQCDPIDYVDSLCVNMQLFPPEHYITGDELLYEYDAQLIERCQSYLVSEKVNICWLSRRFEKDGLCNMKEKWFQTPYSMEDIPRFWLEEWNRIIPRPDVFHIPEPNEYIATDFSIQEPDVFASAYPTVLRETPNSKLWYKKDSKFKVPKAFCYFKCISPLINQSPQNRCLMNLFIRAVGHKLDEIAYDADVALLSYDVNSTDIALTVKVSGFNHKLFKLFQTIVDHVCDFDISEELFSAVKEAKAKYYYNTYIKPSELVTDLRLQILMDKYWTSVDRQVVLGHMTRDMLLRFINQLKEEMFVEGLVQGNVTVSEAKEYETYLLQKLQYRPLSNNLMPNARVSQIPVGQWYCRTENFNKDDTNSVIVNYYQHGPATMKQYCLNELMSFKMQEPCFDILRTREQLGYEVYNMNRVTEGVLAFSITVCSQADKFTMQQLDDRIEGFLIEFEAMLEKMTPQEFESVKESLIGLKKCEDTSLYQEASRNWEEILGQTRLYDRIEREIVCLEKITREELLDWYKDHVLGSGNCRKLSVQVQGNVKPKLEDNSAAINSPSHPDGFPDCKKMKETRGPTMENENSDSLINPVIKYLQNMDDTILQHKIITDALEFKRKNKLYPVSKIIH